MEGHLWKGNTSAQNLTELNCREIYVPVVYPASGHIFAVCAGVRKVLLRTLLTLRKCSTVTRPWDKGRGGWSSRPLDKGRGEVSKKLFSALRASVWSKNKRGALVPRAPPLNPPLKCRLCLQGIAIAHRSADMIRKLLVFFFFFLYLRWVAAQWDKCNSAKQNTSKSHKTRNKQRTGMDGKPIHRTRQGVEPRPPVNIKQNARQQKH